MHDANMKQVESMQVESKQVEGKQSRRQAKSKANNVEDKQFEGKQSRRQARSKTSKSKASKVEVIKPSSILIKLLNCHLSIQSN